MKPGTKRQAPSAETGLAAANQNPEQLARDGIDAKLLEAGWSVQAKSALNFAAAPGIAVREYQTDQGPADYVLFVNKQAVGVIEAKPQDCGHRITRIWSHPPGSNWRPADYETRGWPSADVHGVLFRSV